MNILITNTDRQFEQENIMTTISIDNAIEKLYQKDIDVIILDNNVSEMDEKKLKAVINTLQQSYIVMRQETEDLDKSIEIATDIWQTVRREQLNFVDTFDGQQI
ncbi:hypothetical protein [Rhizosphaericola mali]|uniref:Uncharacterized protein n=1 Tax=Rhizosphaericola mali TaxID=2545455 RepID=A0A5P2G937_9BACT|nr:hypothetical protein [Rhizosphaericola mali]QES90829.1 hypothetical protein E0W69_019990 [Rhizosphaericola mali]